MDLGMRFINKRDLLAEFVQNYRFNSLIGTLE